MLNKEMTCILCPQGCQLDVAYVLEEKRIVEVEGNRCPRGLCYAQEEVFHPTRTLTTTIRVEGGVYPVLPVKSARAIPKELIPWAMDEVSRVVVQAPVEMGQVLVGDLAGTGVELVATRGMGVR